MSNMNHYAFSGESSHVFKKLSEIDPLIRERLLAELTLGQLADLQVGITSEDAPEQAPVIPEQTDVQN